MRAIINDIICKKKKKAYVCVRAGQIISFLQKKSILIVLLIFASYLSLGL